MNITLNPVQFLTLYNSVSKDSSPEAKEVKNKMDSILLEVLSSSEEVDKNRKFGLWMKKEREKLSQLEDKLDSINNNVKKKNHTARR
jgi:hypothetical protein